MRLAVVTLIVKGTPIKTASHWRRIISWRRALYGSDFQPFIEDQIDKKGKKLKPGLVKRSPKSQDKLIFSIKE